MRAGVVGPTNGEAPTACTDVADPVPLLLLAACAGDTLAFAWTPNFGDEVGVNSVPEPVPRFISDAGVTGARADFGVLEADEVAVIVAEMVESLLSDPGADTGVYIGAIERLCSAIGNNAGDDWLTEMG